jgi:8-oxo-dGTP pyrophosphatase MutT (NUDIX family)
VIDVAEIVAAVAGFDPGGSARAAESREQTLALLRTHPRPLDRSSYDPGHVTASGIVLSPDRARLLLVFHRRLGRWLQPGGHLEAGDRSTMEAAHREVTEETGVTPDPAIPPWLVGIDVHEIPAARGEPPHLHHDLVYRFIGRADLPRPSAEVSQAAWWAVDQLDTMADEPLRRAVRRAAGFPP